MLDQGVDDLNEAVVQSRGGIATLWGYSVSLSELSIRISWLGTSENIHLVCNGCIRIEAGASWGDVDFEWQRSEGGQLTLIDHKASFLLLCGHIRVLRNVEPMFVAH